MFAQGPSIEPRLPKEVMTLDRMGCAFPTRLSFMMTLVRRLCREGWRIALTDDTLDGEGYGRRIYTATGPERSYSLLCFSVKLDPEQRNDRVIADAWDATFVLFDGVPSPDDVTRLSESVPLQEAARFRASELVLSRANRSVRVFEHVVSRLAAGEQPDPLLISRIGYLFRTTAVYGNGKFGLADRDVYAWRNEISGPFQAEFLAVYLIRLFTLDLVEHIARGRGGAAAVCLSPETRRFMGVGNSTGLGMAPFLVNHPALIDSWVAGKEAALARVRERGGINPQRMVRFRESLSQARRHLAQWSVSDRLEHERIKTALNDLQDLQSWLFDEKPTSSYWDSVYRWCLRYPTYTQELVVSLLLDPHGDLIDDITDTMTASDQMQIDAAMSVGAVCRIIEQHYAWALRLDLSTQDAKRQFWYVSEEKQEPRLGNRYLEAGADRELPFAVAEGVQKLWSQLSNVAQNTPIGSVLVHCPEYVDIVQRVQTTARCPYGEIQANLIAGDCQPLDILRCKLAFFGAAKFDPKSEKWLRITLFQGAPLPNELLTEAGDGWLFAALPET